MNIKEIGKISNLFYEGKWKISKDVVQNPFKEFKNGSGRFIFIFFLKSN